MVSNYVRTVCEKLFLYVLFTLPSSSFTIKRFNVSSFLYLDFFSDYVFGDRKFGGNAQSIIRNRWIHHTSFLWDYNVRNMAYLKLPSKVPQYRLV